MLNPRMCKKLLNFILQKYRFQTVYMHDSSAFSVAILLRLDGKFHAHTCTYAGSIDQNQAKIHAFVSAAMFLFSIFLAGNGGCGRSLF